MMGPLGIGIGIGLAMSRPHGAVVPGLMLLPQQSKLIASWSVDNLYGLADGSKVSTWTDTVANMAATPLTAGKGPTYKAAAYNGKPGVLFNPADAGDASCIMQTAVAGALAGAVNTFEIMVVMSNTPTDYQRVAVSSFGAGYMAVSSAPTAGARAVTGPLPNPADLNCIFVSSTDLAINGGVLSTDGTGSWGGNFGIGGYTNGVQPHQGYIHEIRIWSAALGLSDKIRATRWACDKYGKAYPWAGQSNYKVFLGDSLTYGYHATGWYSAYPFGVTTSFTPQVPIGNYSACGYIGYTWSQLEAVAAAGIDDLHLATGIPTCLIVGEWYNEAQVEQTGDVHVAARFFLQNRKNAGIATTVFWTSIDTNSSASASFKAGRAAYNAYWDNAANRAGLIDRYVPVHLDANIGVAGSCPAQGTSNTYFYNDGIHMVDPGYAALKSLVYTQMSGL